ncbi:sensor histidine kinase (plasmid) [Brasilonema octagenarum UFV-E1]|uniref:histidine kinase n=2 Tax=Brasilonema TaxID=383614 RepID=A0A856MMX6_9CYAN|nr:MULTISPECIES: ATP-binding protein [Brasilonema]NMF62533.1 sensor histidine kinase [Brasilonema octagenarum UFV-OR1]QDL12785.1 sensor histidine kinase [Brasilonema sennae CENA114]QDL19181.1 sensor histidine kinase [Brasilonema octagenarum UFV-E1]
MAVGSSNHNLMTDDKDLQSLDLQNFCQLQTELLTTQSPIFFARIVYHDLVTKDFQEVMSLNQRHLPVSQMVLTYLREETWLTNFPNALTLNELNLDFLISSKFYFCPLRYRNHKPEYIQIFAETSLSESLQEQVRKTALILTKYFDLFFESERQKAEILLLEQTIQRASHQLRNSLSLIDLYAQNLCFGLKDNSYQEEQARVIRDSVQELDTNLNELIYCGQSTKLRISLQDLKSIVTESLQGLKPLIDNKQLKICLPENSTTLVVDRLQMKQVFDNLLSNTVHFSPQFGTIVCSWQIFKNEVLIKISDQGIGLSQEDLQKMFTPFYSRRVGGTGLGLTIAKKIVLDHHGCLYADNLPTGGAQFSIVLPRSITT